LDSIFVHTQLKNKLKIQQGLNPHNFPSGYIREIFLVQTTWDLGDNYGKMHTSLWRMPW